MYIQIVYTFTDTYTSMLVVTYSLTESSITLHWPYRSYGTCNHTVTWDSGSSSEVVHTIEPYIIISTKNISLETVIYMHIEAHCMCHLYYNYWYYNLAKCTEKIISKFEQICDICLELSKGVLLLVCKYCIGL